MSNFVTKRLPNAKLYYGLAALAKFMFTLTVLVELYYFSAFLTDNALFQNAIVVMILTATSVLDLVGSFFISVFLSAFNLPWGKIRSWLLIVPPIVVVFYTLSFVRIGTNEVLSAILIIISFFISHLFWNVGEAACNSMSMVCTDDPDERTNFSVWLGRGANFAVLPFAVVAAFLLNQFAKLSPNFSYAGLTLVMSILYLVGFWALFKATDYTVDKNAAKIRARQKKNAEEAQARGETPKESALRSLLLGFKYTFMNKHLVITIIALSACNCANSMMSASLYYVFEYTFAGNALMTMSVFVFLQGLIKIIGSLVIIPWFLKMFRGNKKAVFNVTMLLQGLFLVAAFAMHGKMLVCVVILLASHFFGSVPMIIYLSLFQDCTIYSEFLSGKDVSPFIMGMTVMPIKVGNAFKSIVMSGFLVMIGYTATVADPHVYATDFAFLHMLLCGIIMIASCVAHTIIYRLPADKVERMETVNRKRRAKIAAGIPQKEAQLEAIEEVGS